MILILLVTFNIDKQVLGYGELNKTGVNSHKGLFGESQAT